MRSQSTLLFTITADAHADRILSLAPPGHPFTRLNLDNPSDWTLSFHNGDVSVRHRDGELGLDDISSVFVRRIPSLDAHKPVLPELASEYSDYIAQQTFALFTDCLAILDTTTRFVNPLAAVTKQGKSVQAHLARQVGFSTPMTYVGQDPGRALQFCEKIFAAGERPCVKPIVNSKVEINGKPHTQFTSILERSSLAELKTLSLCPTIFQQYVSKAYEVRATVIGDRIFAAKIDSQQAGLGTSTDWRRYDIPKTPHLALELPSEVKQRILELQAKLGLLYSAFDFIVTPDGDYVFLETNAYGQWLWIEDLTGLPISKAIVDYLATPRIH